MQTHRVIKIHVITMIVVVTSWESTEEAPWGVSSPDIGETVLIGVELNGFVDNLSVFVATLP